MVFLWFFYIYILYPSWVRWQPPHWGIPPCQLKGLRLWSLTDMFSLLQKWCSEHQAASPLPHEIYIYLSIYLPIYLWRFPDMGVLIRFSIINISKPSIWGYHHGKPHQSTYSLVFDVAKDLRNHPKSRHSTLSVEVCPALPGKISVKIRGLIEYWYKVVPPRQLSWFIAPITMVYRCL